MNNIKCDNLCKYSDKQCEYCKENYVVSKEFYKARRPANNKYVVGYLVKDKNDNINGILNKDANFAELASIVEDTVELIK